MTVTPEDVLQQALGAQAAGRHDEAAGLFGLVLELCPGEIQALWARAQSLAALGRFEAAATDLRAATTLVTDNAALWCALANAELRLWRLTEGLQAADRAVALDPNLAYGHFNRGYALHELNRPADSLAAYERAAAIEPDKVSTWKGIGVTRLELGLHAAALDAFDRALAINPDDPAAVWNRGALLLMLGRFDEGWPLMEARRQRLDLGEPLPDLGPPWLGETPLAGKTLLIRSEQGMGDTLHFCRYANLAADRGARVVLQVDAALVEVLRSLRGADQVIAKGEPLPRFDLHCPVLSLPLAFHPEMPNQPYLCADPAKSALWRRRLGPRRRLRVGLVWSGGSRPEQREVDAINARRNIALPLLAPLAAIDADFFSLQKGAQAEQALAALAAQGWSGPDIIDLTTHIRDFSDTAALIDNLDLVISVDTSTPHLAAAMGKPVWILNRFDACWRWLLDRCDSPWYPTVRLFRQPSPGEWAPVVQQVVAALQEFSPPDSSLTA